MSEERLDAPVNSQRLNEMVHGPRYRATLLESELMADELLSLRQLRALVLASRPALEAGAGALDDVGHVSWCGVYTSTSGDCDCGYFERCDHAAQLRTLSAYLPADSNGTTGEK